MNQGFADMVPKQTGFMNRCVNFTVKSIIVYMYVLGNASFEDNQFNMSQLSCCQESMIFCW